jgi:hypothetical protein
VPAGFAFSLNPGQDENTLKDLRRRPARRKMALKKFARNRAHIQWWNAGVSSPKYNQAARRRLSGN